MKYRIFVISHSEGYDVELHNLEREANPTNLCYTTLKKDVSLGEAQDTAEEFQIVLGLDVCDIIPTHRVK